MSRVVFYPSYKTINPATAAPTSPSPPTTVRSAEEMPVGLTIAALEVILEVLDAVLEAEPVELQALLDAAALVDKVLAVPVMTLTSTEVEVEVADAITVVASPLVVVTHATDVLTTGAPVATAEDVDTGAAPVAVGVTMPLLSL